MKNTFANTNVEHWFKWIFRRSDHLPAATVYFLSRRNSTSPRLFPLYRYSSQFRIILFKGSFFPYLDLIHLFILKSFCRIFAFKLSKYNWVAIYDHNAILKLNANVVLHLDDPEYSTKELENLRLIEKAQNDKGKTTTLVVTNNYTFEQFNTRLKQTQIEILPQGYIPAGLELNRDRDSRFSIVYSSPYIDYRGDKHEEHTAWSATHLLDFIIPEILNADSEIKIRLIGRIGKNAGKYLANFPSVQCFGLVSFEQNSLLLRESTIGIYPRKFDHKRSVQKIYEYMGAGLPTVAYRLIDTLDIEKQGWGLLVQSQEEFIAAVLRLKNDTDFLNLIRKRIEDSKQEYSWNSISKKYDSLVSNPRMEV